MFTKRRLSSTLQKRSADKLSFNVEDFKSMPKNTPTSVQFQVRKPPKDFVEQTTPLLTSQLYNW